MRLVGVGVGVGWRKWSNGKESITGRLGLPLTILGKGCDI